jgi:hypothetical protein
MTLIGLDLNATRARAVHGPAAAVPSPLPLDGPSLELPVALSLEGRQPVVGRAGAGLCRKAPHLACLDFLPFLGLTREWIEGRHRLDALRALGAVFEYLKQPFGKIQGLALAVPAYLSRVQKDLVARLAEKARFCVHGVVAAPVVAALAAQEQLPWTGRALIGDLDRHALTWSSVIVENEKVRLRDTSAATHLGRGAWLRRLLDGVSERCVRMSRRDPRNSAEADQSLYDQLEVWLETPPKQGVVELVVQTPQWYQNLLLQPEELTAFCAPLVHQALEAMHGFLEATADQGPLAAVLLTSPAGRMPGLVAGLEESVELPAVLRPPDEGSDFGENLLLEDGAAPARIHVLGDDDLARAAHELAARLQKGSLKPGQLETLPLTPAPDPGPARLNFQGKDYFLSGASFTLGRDPHCDLVFESAIYPSVSKRHCEIVLDHSAYVLRDRSRHGTLVNDRPVNQSIVLQSGYWIRLGPGGPMLRFLGRSTDQHRLLTIA